MELNYYSYEEESYIGNARAYVELCEQYAIRQVLIKDNIIFGSNICYPKWGLLLPEGKLKINNIPEIKAISKEEFELVWQKHLTNHLGAWEITKIAYPKGEYICGFIKIFHPLGVIVNFGDGVLGIADYQACKESTKLASATSGLKIIATVADYDEVNHWLILDSPRVIDNSYAQLDFFLGQW